MAAEESKDLVLSYIVGSKGVEGEGHEAMKKALEEGYRVIDVISTPSCGGRASNFPGFVSVTVVLTKYSGHLTVPYKAYTQ